MEVIRSLSNIWNKITVKNIDPSTVLDELGKMITGKSDIQYEFYE